VVKSLALKKGQGKVDVDRLSLAYLEGEFNPHDQHWKAEEEGKESEAGQDFKK
jgi:hypothetical protein